MQRMQTEAQELKAEGIVGVSLSERSHGWGSHVIEFFAIGTAIIPSEERGDVEPRSRCSISTTAESLRCSSGYALECWSVSPSGESSSCDGAPGSLSAESLCDPPSAPGSSGRSSGRSGWCARSRWGLTAGSWG